MSNLSKDLRVYAGKSILKKLYVWFFGSSFKVLRNYRLAHWFHKKHLSFVAAFITRRTKRKYNMDIDYRAQLGGGLRFVHGFGVVIGKDVITEENVTIYQHVTLGGNQGKTATYGDRTIEMPYLCRGATVYGGAFVIGPVVIGENSRVGVNTVVTKDVPPDSVAINQSSLVIKPLRKTETI